MTDKRQKAAKVKWKAMNLWVNIWVFWSSFADEHNTLPKSTRRNVNIEQICIWNYRIYYVNIDLRHQYGISVAESQTLLLAKRPSAAMSEEKRLPSAGYRIPKSLNVESGILGLGIRNTAVGNRNPTKDCNPNPSSTDKDWNEVLGIRNLLHGIQDLKMSWGPLQGANRPLASSKNPHFQNEARCTTFLVKMSFICMRMKNDFHIKGWAPTLVLKQRPGGTGQFNS